MTFTFAVYTVLDSWWWTENLSGTYRDVPPWSSQQAINI